jgi:hypothetical protein
MSTSYSTHLRRLAALSAVAAVGFAAPAGAAKPDNAGKPADRPAKAQGPKKEKKAKKVPARCKTGKKHAFVSAGTVVAHTLVANPDGTVDGTVTVKVDRTNKHARADRSKEVVYTVDDAKIKVATGDRNADGTVDLADAQVGDRVQVKGKIARLHKKCASNGTTATPDLGRVTIAAPKPAAEPAPAPAPAPAA